MYIIGEPIMVLVDTYIYRLEQRRATSEKQKLNASNASNFQECFLPYQWKDQLLVVHVACLLYKLSNIDPSVTNCHTQWTNHHHTFPLAMSVLAVAGRVLKPHTFMEWCCKNRLASLIYRPLNFWGVVNWWLTVKAQKQGMVREM